MSDDASPVVLLVDDDEAVRESLALLLRSVGLRSQCFASPQDFLAGIPYPHVGCVVLDIRMPGMSGLEVLAQQTMVSDLPVIMLTGHGSVDLCRRAFKSGAAEFLEKPVDDEVFIDAVQKAVRQHIASRALVSESQDARKRLASLSGREREVLEHIAYSGQKHQVFRFKSTIRSSSNPPYIPLHRGPQISVKQGQSFHYQCCHTIDAPRGEPACRPALPLSCRSPAVL